MTPTVGMSTLLPRRPQPDVLVTGLVGNVGDDQLKHFISDAHAAVCPDDFSWRRERVIRITGGVVVKADTFAAVAA